MQQVYGDDCLSRANVFLWYKRFLEGRETLEDDSREDQFQRGMIEKVREFVENDRNASLEMMEEALNISRETIRTILHEDFNKGLCQICSTHFAKKQRVIHAEEVFSSRNQIK